MPGLSASAIHTPNSDQTSYHTKGTVIFLAKNLPFVLDLRYIDKFLRNLAGDGIISAETGTIKL